MDTNSGKAFDYGLFRRLVGHTRPYRTTFFSVALAAILLSIFAVLTASFAGKSVNEAIKVKDSEKLFREYKDTEDERVHKTLVEGFDDKTVVYFGKIKSMENDMELIKIGCTKNIRSRITGLKMEFGSMSIFKIFECDNHDSFESFLHGHIDIRRYAHKEVINGLKKSQEVFIDSNHI